MAEAKLIDQLRALRKREGVALKPSPYLRQSFVNDAGEEVPVNIRNYQGIGILNMLQMERMILADDTGLGKTLEVLSTLGYLWMKEPEYVPIIITTKSALFQWEAETRKFTKDIEPCTVHGEPHERHKSYSDFFVGHDSGRKRILLLTYDMVMRDVDGAVIRDRDHVPEKGVKKKLAEAKAAAKEQKALYDQELLAYEAAFEGAGFDVSEYLTRALAGPLPPGTPDPPGWDEAARGALSRFLTVRARAQQAKKAVDDLSFEVAPAKRVPGILDYMQELQAAHPGVKFMLVMDEMHKLKNHRSQFHLKVHAVSTRCQRLVGMTATPVKNRLMEFFSLFRVIQPTLFPKVTHFQAAYCVMKMQAIGGGRQVPVVVGYKNLDHFVETVEPFFLSRKKHEVAKELPELLSREVECELHDMQEELYDLAETGLIAQDDAGDLDESAAMLSALTLVQQAVNAPQLIADEEGKPFEGPSTKIDALVDLILDEADGQKVIVFSRFEKMISLVEKALSEVKHEDESGRKRTGIKNVRITGKEDPRVREKHKNLFQDKSSGVNVVLLTTAGSESINLQSAEHFVFLDLPYSWGDYIQLTGRMIRIGSSHSVVTAHHFLARRQSGAKTIDHKVLQILRGKKKLADKVAGESIVGGLQFTDAAVSRDIMAMMREEAVASGGKKGALLDKVNAQIAARRAKADKAGAPVKSASRARRFDEPAVVSVDVDLSDI